MSGARARTLCLGVLTAVLVGCTGDVGTISIDLVWAPGTDPLATAATARLQLSNPQREVSAPIAETDRLELEVESRKELATITFIAEDDDGNEVARGRTPPLPLTAIDFRLTIFIAPPWSITRAPVDLESPRTGIGGARLSFGAALVGGVLANGTASSDLLVYSAFDHTLDVGASLPEPRGHSAVLGDARGLVYIFGGIDENGVERSTTWRFNSGVPPAGSYAAFPSPETTARQGAILAPLGNEQYLVTGAPLALIDGYLGTVELVPGGDSIDGPAAAVLVGDDFLPHALVVGRDAGATGAAMIRAGVITNIDAPTDARRRRHQVLSLGTRVLIVGGVDDADLFLGSAVVFEPVERSFTTTDAFLEVPRADVGAAVSDRHIVIAGGVIAGELVSDVVEVFETFSLEPVARLTMAAPRRLPTVVDLDNGQFLVAGGTDQSGSPVAGIELLTPGD